MCKNLITKKLIIYFTLFLFLTSCATKISHQIQQKLETNIENVYVKNFRCEDGETIKFNLVNNSEQSISIVELHIYDQDNDPIEKCVYKTPLFGNPVAPYSGDEIGIYYCDCSLINNIGFKVF